MTFPPRYCDALCAARVTQFSYMLSWLVPVSCCGSWSKLCARKLHTLVRRYARAMCPTVVQYERWFVIDKRTAIANQSIQLFPLFFALSAVLRTSSLWKPPCREQRAACHP